LLFKRPRGTQDILPPEVYIWQKTENTIRQLCAVYGYEEIRTPLFEYTELFNRGVGETTDIVEKEMYILKTKEGKEALALRPEGTAPIMRAYLEHGFNAFPQPVKFWYFGPFFRHERPQAGRYRQFWQFGCEVLGEKSPIIDAQVILIIWNILNELGLDNTLIRINSIGDENCRKDYRKALVKFLRSQKGCLCRDCLRRVKTNPLRVLDCKNEKCREVLSEAPQIIDFLCNECRVHLKEVLEYLEELKIPYILDPFLVRGLDYYTKTVFEIETPQEEDEGALAGGGRYDILAKALGKTNVPACGAAVGVERIVSLMKKRKLEGDYLSLSKVFIAQIGPLAKKKEFNHCGRFEKSRDKSSRVFKQGFVEDPISSSQ